MCIEVKEDTCFYEHAILCKPCHNKRGKIWWQNNKEKARKVQYKSKLKIKYNLTIEEYEELYSNQQGRCKICFSIPHKKLHVDHCHTTGRVRGLLCENCNRGLGMFKDNIDLLEKAKEYISSASFY